MTIMQVLSAATGHSVSSRGLALARHPKLCRFRTVRFKDPRHTRGRPSQRVAQKYSYLPIFRKTGPAPWPTVCPTSAPSALPQLPTMHLRGSSRRRGVPRRSGRCARPSEGGRTETLRTPASLAELRALKTGRDAAPWREIAAFNMPNISATCITSMCHFSFPLFCNVPLP